MKSCSNWLMGVHGHSQKFFREEIYSSNLSFSTPGYSSDGQREWIQDVKKRNDENCA